MKRKHKTLRGLLMDILAAGLALMAFALFHHVLPREQQKEKAFALRKAILKGETMQEPYIGLTEKADAAVRATIDETWGQIL